MCTHTHTHTCLSAAPHRQTYDQWPYVYLETFKGEVGRFAHRLICLCLSPLLQGGGWGWARRSFAAMFTRLSFQCLFSVLEYWLLCAPVSSCSEDRVPMLSEWPFIQGFLNYRVLSCPVSSNLHNQERWARIFKVQIISLGSLFLDKWLICVLCHWPAL